MSLRVAVVAAVCSLLLGASVQAHAKPKLAVLGIEPADDGDASSQEKTARLARWLTERLRERAAAARAKYEIAPNSNRELAEVKLLSDCLDEGNACMAAIGRELGADRLMYGRLQRKGGDYHFTLKLFNVDARSLEKQKKDRFQAASAGRDTAERIAAMFFGDLTGLPVEGTLVVRANVATGTVMVDGEPRGVIANGTATVRGLPEGTVAIAVESPGYRRWEGAAEVRAGRDERLDVALEPGGDERELPGTGREQKTSRKTYRVLAWTSAVVTAGGITAFTITGLKVWKLEDDKTSEIKASWNNTSEKDRITSIADACAEAAADGYAPVDDICKRGKQMAMLTNVLIGVSATMALATGYFAYKGYVQADRERGPGQDLRARRRKPASRVMVAPQLYPEGGGLGAVIQF